MTKFNEPKIDLYAIGKEMMLAAQFEEKYYAMEADRDYWRDKFQNLLQGNIDHNHQMIGGLLSVALKMGEQK